MGCFSFLCKESAKPANSTSFDGDACRLFLLKDGKVIEEMHGNYDSYGRVFDGSGSSLYWDLDWEGVCDLMFSDDKSNGIAMILDECWSGFTPTTRSEDDPNQGWSEDSGFIKVAEPSHKVSSTKVTATITAETQEQLQLLVNYMCNSGEQADCFVEESLTFEYNYTTGDINITTYKD